MLTEVSGEFVKIVWADDPDVHLMRGAPERPPARFNRRGQDALYLSPDIESAKVAIVGFAIERLDEAEAKKTLSLFDELAAGLDQAED